MFNWRCFNYKIRFCSRYRENVKKISSLLRESVAKPMDVAVYWVEHVLKYGGAKHLQHAGLKLRLYEYYLLDVIAFLTGVVVLVALFNYYITKKLWNCAKRKLLPKKVKTN